jgi:hypothetical protein
MVGLVANESAGATITVAGNVTGHRAGDLVTFILGQGPIHAHSGICVIDNFAQIPYENPHP